MIGFIRSVNSAPEGKKDSVQIRIKEDEMLEHGEELLALKRYHYVIVKATSNQSAMTSDGTSTFPTLRFKAVSTSFLITVLPSGQLATLTFSVDQEDQILEKVINNHIKGIPVEISFEEGEDPNQDE